MRVIDSVDKTFWEEVAGNCAYATFFHTPYWAELMAHTFNYIDITKGFIFDDGTRAVFPFMYKKRSLVKGLLSDYVSGPPYTYGGPIAEKELSKQQLDEIVEYINSTFRHYHTILIRGNPFGPQRALADFKEVKDISYIIELYKYHSERELLKSYSDRISTDINKAKKSDIIIKKATAIEDYEKLYTLYQKSSTHWEHNLTNYPLQLFQNAYYLHNTNSTLWTAYHNSKMIGGDISLFYNTIGNWWLSYYDREYSKYFARRYVLHHILLECKEKGITYYDLGVGSGIKGIEFYKTSMGGKEYHHSAWLKENNLLKKLRNIKRSITSLYRKS